MTVQDQQILQKKSQKSFQDLVQALEKIMGGSPEDKSPVQRIAKRIPKKPEAKIIPLDRPKELEHSNGPRMVVQPLKPGLPEGGLGCCLRGDNGVYIPPYFIPKISI